MAHHRFQNLLIGLNIHKIIQNIGSLKSFKMKGLIARETTVRETKTAREKDIE
jgi:hypothetical protein